MTCWFITLLSILILIFAFANSTSTPNEAFINDEINSISVMYHNKSDCILDGSCRLPPNNDSFWDYPAAAFQTSTIKVNCDHQSNVPCGCARCLSGSTETKFSHCSNLPYTNNCFFQAL